MGRRDLVLLAGAALVSPRLAGAQQADRMRRVGYLTAATGGPDDVLGVVQTRALVEGLRELGWFDGRNITLEHRFSGSGRERMRANAKELVALNPDVIVSVGGLQLEALLAETRTIPIVFTSVSDPVASGFVASLGHPGGNATGVAVHEAPLAAKWLELLKETAPEITRALVIMAADSRPQQVMADSVAAAAPSLRLTLGVASGLGTADYDAGGTAVVRARAGRRRDRAVKSDHRQQSGEGSRASGAIPPAGGLQLSDLRPHRRSDLLWARYGHPVSRGRPLCRQDPARRTAGRLAGAAADPVHARRQFEDREGARPDRPAIDPRPRRRGHRVRRRHLLAAGPALLVCARLGWAQQPGRVYRLGGLVFRGSSAASRDPAFAAFLDEPARAGFVEGKNLLLDNSGISNRTDELPERAARLVAEGVCVIFSAGSPAAAAALHATAEKPIAAIVDDMLASGLVPSLSQPGGNLTGISILATELDGKRQEILFELLPNYRRMAALADPGVGSPAHLESLRNAALQRGVELSVYKVRDAEEIASAIEAARAGGAEALNVLASPLLHSNRRLIFERSVATRLPAIYQWAEAAEEGGLTSYGPRFAGVYRLFARQLIKLLRGAKPAAIPVEQPTNFELVVNLKTGKALAVTVPPSILARADEVIE